MTAADSSGPYPFDRRWAAAQAAALACTLEAAAPKVGNVHPGSDFRDMHFGHFAVSALVIQDSIRERPHGSVGELVLHCVRAIRARAGRNTNLGTILLLAPLVCAVDSCASTRSLQDRTGQVLGSLTQLDCHRVYIAIAETAPGGLGRRAVDDVAGAAPESLVEAMRQVADIDAVARQYTNQYADLFQRLLPWFVEELAEASSPLEAICRLQVRALAHEPDGLIIRKLGLAAADEIQQMAAAIVASAAWRQAPLREQSEVQAFDKFLRADGNGRNPGTTADLIAATLFIALVGE